MSYNSGVDNQFILKYLGNRKAKEFKTQIDQFLCEEVDLVARF